MTTATEVRTALPSLTADGRARAAALQAHTATGAGVGTVGYRSQGNLLIIGALPEAVSCARALQPALQCVLLVEPSGDPGAQDTASGKAPMISRLPWDR